MSFLTWVGNEVEVKGLNKKTYKLAPLSLRQWGQYIKWVQFKPYRDAVNADLPKAHCDKILSDCETGLVEELVDDENGGTKLEKFPIHIGSSIVTNTFSNIDGIAELLYISLKKHHPLIERTEIDEIVDLVNFPKIQKAIFQLNGLSDEEEIEDSEKN